MLRPKGQQPDADAAPAAGRRVPRARRNATLRAGWRRMRPLLGNRAGEFTALIAAGIGAGICEAAVLALIANIATAMVGHHEWIRARLGPLTVRIGVGAALATTGVIALVRLGLQVLAAWLPAHISADVAARTAGNVFDAFTRASWAEQAEEREGHLQELMTNQISQATELIFVVMSALASGAMILGLLVAALLLSPVVAAIVLVSAVMLSIMLRPLRRFGGAAARDLSRANMGKAEGVSESLRLAEEANVFGAWQAQRSRLGDLIDQVRAKYFRFRFTAGLANSCFQGAAILLIVGGLAGLYASGATGLASLGAVVLMLVRASSYGQMLQGAHVGLEQLLPYLDRLDATAARYVRSAPADGDHPLPTLRTLAFEKAGFSYRRGSPALIDISFKVDAGEAIGIVGATGAGKSTLIQLLLRLRHPSSGTYLINGDPAEAFSRLDWQHRVAYVSQEPRVFRGTVADNVRYFRDVDRAAIERAASLAHIHEEILAMPVGYDTTIGQRADAVSGGQRQRICIARALVGEPDLLVLDEPTSALDLGSEAAVEASLVGLRGRLTMIIASHRPSILGVCDRILVLDSGRLSAIATAPELAGSSAVYRRVLALAD